VVAVVAVAEQAVLVNQQVLHPQEVKNLIHLIHLKWVLLEQIRIVF
jgi:hypothetical protein